MCDVCYIYCNILYMLCIVHITSQSKFDISMVLCVRVCCWYLSLLVLVIVCSAVMRSWSGWSRSVVFNRTNTHKYTHINIQKFNWWSACVKSIQQRKYIYINFFIFSFSLFLSYFISMRTRKRCFFYLVRCGHA